MDLFTALAYVVGLECDSRTTASAVGFKGKSWARSKVVGSKGESCVMTSKL
jgi:hypothetical protein